LTGGSIVEGADPVMSWLKRPNRTLAGHASIDLLNTDARTEQVVELLDSPIRRRFANELSMGFTVEGNAGFYICRITNGIGNQLFAVILVADFLGEASMSTRTAPYICLLVLLRFYYLLYKNGWGIMLNLVSPIYLFGILG
jgi:hypothetical protein